MTAVIKLRGSMTSDMILCDLGGTHARLCLMEQDHLKGFQKYRLQEFKDHITLFEHYRQVRDAETRKLLISAAGCHYGDHAPSGLQHNSKISEQYFQDNGYQQIARVNDLFASAWGAWSYPEDNKLVLHKGEVNESCPDRCVIGPGTGLGCALILHNGYFPLIRKTFGGHMRPAPATDEQAELLFDLQKKQNKVIVYEDIASGKGLENLYYYYKGVALQDPGILITRQQDPDHKKILRLFHEFLGLYIQNILISTHCFSEVVLCGGLLDFLFDHDHFDFAIVKHFIDQPYVDVVQTALKNTPISYINNTYLALYGLQNYWRMKHAKGLPDH